MAYSRMILIYMKHSILLCGYPLTPFKLYRILIIYERLNGFSLIFQLPHLATTYAAVNSLVTLGGDKALSSINRWSGYAIIEFDAFIGSYLTKNCNFLQRKTVHVFAANERHQWGFQVWHISLSFFKFELTF